MLSIDFFKFIITFIMKQKYTFLFLAALLFTVTSFSQAKYIYYFDNDFNSASKANAVFTGFGSIENGRVKVNIINNATKQPAIVAFYTDSTLKVSKGLYQSFYSNGTKESEGNYDNNKENGLWQKWDSTGHLIDSTVYENAKKISSSTFHYYKNGVLSFHDFNDLKNDKELKLRYDEKGNKLSEVTFIGQTGYIKTFKENEIVKLDTVYSKQEIEASFPGGEAAWTKYLFSQLNEHYKELISDGRSGTCRIRFIVNKDGKVSNVEALTMKGSTLAEVAVNALKNGPKWNPAMQYGRAVNAYREQPVTFTISER